MPSPDLQPNAAAGPRVRVTCREEFSAAHQLEAPGLDPEANRRLYGPCAQLHGHNYHLEVTVEGPVDPSNGMVLNFSELFELLRREVHGACDHKRLETDVPFLAGRISTAENIAVALWDLLLPHTRSLGVDLVSLRLSETSRTAVEYRGPAGYGGA